MEFAKKVLNKYGWKEGQGLGKNNDGIVTALRAHMKFDNMGLGVDRAKEFNDHWWERCFNEAATNIDISNSKKDDAVQVNVKDAENGVEITTNSYSIKKLKKAKNRMGDDKVKYGNFIYAASLTNTGDTIENPFKVSLDDIAVTPVKVLTDEELFKACGGRTAHKGARHGLKLSGKLARLEQQEAELLTRMQKDKEKIFCNAEDVTKDENQQKSKKCKKKSKEHERSTDEKFDKPEKKLKKHKSSLYIPNTENCETGSTTENTNDLRTVDVTEPETDHMSSKKKSKKTKTTVDVDIVDDLNENLLPPSPKKKRKYENTKSENDAADGSNTEFVEQNLNGANDRVIVNDSLSKEGKRKRKNKKTKE